MGWFDKLFGGKAAAEPKPKIVAHEACGGAIHVLEVPTAEGWQWDELAKTMAAVLLVAALSMSMCFAALRGRVSQN